MELQIQQVFADIPQEFMWKAEEEVPKRYASFVQILKVMLKCNSWT